MERSIQVAGKTLNISFDRVAVVFDKTTGEILHVHRVTVARENHPNIEDDDLRHLALEAARKLVEEQKIAAADVLHVNPEHLHHALSQSRSHKSQLRVDVVGRCLSIPDK